jgi:hypothetical protein
MLPMQYSRVRNTPSTETHQPRAQSRCHPPFDIKITVILDVTPCGLTDKQQSITLFFSDFNQFPSFYPCGSTQIRAFASLKAVKLKLS